MTKVVNRHQLPKGLGIIANMFKGTDPADNALFLQRALKAKGHQLDNTGTQRRLDSNLGMAGNTDMAGQLARSAGLNTDNMTPESLLQFASFFANRENPNQAALGLSTTGGGVDARAAAAQKLTNDNDLAKILLQNEGLAGDKIVQETLNLEDEATNASALNDANIRFRDQETAKTLASMGLAQAESGADVNLTGQKQEAIKEITPAKKALIEAQTKVPEAQAAAITAESEEEVNLLKSKITVQNAIRWVQVAKRRSETSGMRNKNAESAARVLEIQASTGLLGEKANQIIADIANKNYESALRGMKTATEAMVTTLVGGAKVDKFKQEMEVLKQEVLNLQATADNHKNESEARVNLTDGKAEMVDTEIENADLQQTNLNLESAATQDNTVAKTGLVGDKRTTEQALLPRKSDLIDAKTDYWRSRGEGELSDTMLKQAAGAAGKGSGKNQFDYRKTKNAAQMKYDIEDVGVEYTLETPGMFWNSEEVFYLWPEDNDAVRRILSPVIGTGDEKALVAAMAQAKQTLSTAGLDDPEKIQAIIKQILQVTPTPE